MHNQIPEELRLLDQWVAVGPDKMPLDPRTMTKASVVKPSTWGTFEEALASSKHGVGFVISKEDPYTFIDLDDPTTKTNIDGSPKYTPEECEEIWFRQQKIMEHIDSYTELSQSGKGAHIIVKGSIPYGVHRDAIEMYSDSRYMICTGDVFKDEPINEHQEMLDILYNEMTPVAREILVQEDGDLSDEEIWDIAINAENGEKFLDLFEGRLEQHYTSQSEADFGLLSIIAFYTRDNEQVRRIFRMSKLGQRRKAQRNDKYINFALEKIRAKQPPPITEEQLAKLSQLAKPKAKPKSCKIPPMPTFEKEERKPPPKPKPKPSNNHLDFPPGLIGEVANYIYAHSIRPVREISLGAALAFVAGIAGRSYNISGTGLNQYLILVAKTGVGKEGAANGINSLINEVRQKIPMIDGFVGPGVFASGQALLKVLADKPVFLSILGEFGLTLQQICDKKANSADKMMRRVLLDLYGKSGWSQTMQASVYSDKEKNIDSVKAPAVTILGETTPHTFYEGLDEDKVAEGLIPRFSIIEYNGSRPERNRDRLYKPPLELVKKVTDLTTIVLTMANNGTNCRVEYEQEARKLLDKFDQEADRYMNKSDQEVILQLWNRAHLKALKMAALLAVGNDFHNPTITLEQAEWAIQFVREDIDAISRKFSEGEVGTGDHRQDSDLIRICNDFYELQEKQKVNYKVPKKLLDSQLIPYAYLYDRLKRLATFKNSTMGARRSIDEAIRVAVESGFLEEIDRKDIRKHFSINQRCFMIS